MADICCDSSFLDQFKRDEPKTRLSEEEKKRRATASAKAKYEDRKAKGLCPNCGEAREVPAQWLCNHCHTVRKLRNSDKEEYHRRKTEGLCVRCGKNKTDGLTACFECSQRRNKRNKDKYVRKREKALNRQEKATKAKAEGNCVNCFKFPARTNRSTCERCAATAKRRYSDRQQKGLCTECKSPVAPDKQTCEECAAHRRLYTNKKNAESKLEAFTAYGGQFCACCGEDGLQFLQLDHINNDGAARRKSGEDGLGPTLYKQLRCRGYPSGYQVLCANCNWAKDHNGGVCPHRTAISEALSLTSDYHPIDLSEWS
jgi:hypothetical protein